MTTTPRNPPEMRCKFATGLSRDLNFDRQFNDFVIFSDVFIYSCLLNAVFCFIFLQVLSALDILQPPHLDFFQEMYPFYNMKTRKTFQR